MILKRKRLRDHFDTLADYEGKVIRIAKGNTYFVWKGQAVPYPIGSFAPDGSTYGWDSVIELKTMPGDTGNKLVELIDKIPTKVQEQLIDKGKQALGIDERDPGLGPMTADKKRAIQVANGMNNNGVSQMPQGHYNNIMLYVAIAGLILGIMVYMRK